MRSGSPSQSSKNSYVRGKAIAGAELHCGRGPRSPDTSLAEQRDTFRTFSPLWHPAFYSSSRFTLNVTRRDMTMAGSRLRCDFEAAACGATIMSDNWPGLDCFFTPGKEILVPTSEDDVIRSWQIRRRLAPDRRERPLTCTG